MVNFINVTFLVLDALLATFMAVVYLLNIFKKKSILDRMGMYGEDSQTFSFWVAFVLGLLSSAYWVQEPDKMYGFSLGSTMNLIVIGLVLGIIILEGISEWFKKLPET